MADGVGGDDLCDLVVEYPGLAVHIDHQNRMGDLEIEILENDDAHLRIVPAERAQGRELGDGVESDPISLDTELA